MSDFPDKHQKKVIEHRGRPLVVIAGPGERARMILTNGAQSKVAFVTFASHS